MPRPCARWRSCGAGWPPRASTPSAALPEKRVKVVGAQLVAAGAAERLGRKLRRVRALEPAELDRLLSEYEERHADDRERLEEIMQYAQSADCRVRKLREYFSEA